MTAAAIGAILRWILALGAGYLVSHNIWTSADASTYVTAASLALISLGWSQWQKYSARRVLVTALASPFSTTEAAVKAKIASGAIVPTVTTPADTIPGIPKG